MKKPKLHVGLLAVLVLLVTALTGYAQRTSSTSMSKLQSAIQAKRMLAQMDRTKLTRIEDAKLRAELLEGYDALKAVAENTSQARETVLLAKVHRVALKLKAKAEEPKTAFVSLNECNKRLSDCLELGTPPNICGLNDDMCIMFAWISTLFPPGAP
jgi:type II secretory pathway component PulJ